MTFRLRHLLAAVLLHGLLFALLVGGLQCSRTPVRPPVIRAVLLDPDRKEQTARDRRAEERRKAAEKKRAAEERRKKLAAESERKKAEEAKRKAELAEKKKIEEARKQRELAERKKAEEAARRKKEQQEERERQEQARRDIQEKALMEEAMRQETRERELAQEAAARAASEREARQSDWVDALVRHVRKNWNPPPNAPPDFVCTVRVSMLPDGSVVGVPKIVKSCGGPLLDRSVEEAVLRGSPLPLPLDMSIFERELIINFIPR